MTNAVFCTQCGAQNAPSANFCTRCGARLTAQAPGPAAQAPAAPPSPPQTEAPAGPAPAQPAAAAPQAQAEWSAEKEPMLLLDVTGSMNYGTSADDHTPRRDTIREAISIIVATLGAEDSQAGQEGDEGGLRTVTFAGGQAHDIGDLNPANLAQKWARINWAGGTRILPGWQTLLATYMEEFGQADPSERPMLLALIITDGEADDTAPFAQALEQASGLVYAVLAIIGYGPDHDAALQAYQAIAQANPHVRVVTLASQTDPQSIANTLLRMIE